MNLLRTPLVVVATFQPLLFLWIMAISFFLGLAVAAAISSGRTWKQTVSTIVLVWMACTVIGVFGTNFAGIKSVLVEWIFN